MTAAAILFLGVCVLLSGDSLCKRISEVAAEFRKIAWIFDGKPELKDEFIGKISITMHDGDKFEQEIRP